MNRELSKDKAGRWIVDEIVFDPHYPGKVVVRDGDKWHLLSRGQEPREYKAKVSPEYMRLTFDHEYYLYDCVPRGGFRVPLGRAITADEWDDLVRTYNLGPDDISNQFVDSKGMIYGPEATVTYTAKQIRVPEMMALALEQRLLSLGIEANSGASGRLSIRVEPLASGAAQLGSLGGSVKSRAKSEAAKARNAKRKAEGKPEGGRPRYEKYTTITIETKSGKLIERRGRVVESRGPVA